MEKRFFNFEEATAKVGGRVRAREFFLDIPKGAKGQVTKTLFSPSGYSVMILWEDGESLSAVTPLTKDEYEELIEEVGEVISIPLLYQGGGFGFAI